MNLVTLTGIRGGSGTTTVVGMLGDALHALDQRVLLVDLNASDLLLMHFDVPSADGHGWVASSYPDEWRQQACQLDSGLMLVPFGRKAIEDSGVSHLLRGDDFWLQVLPSADRDFDWVLFDCPPCPHRLAPGVRCPAGLAASLWSTGTAPDHLLRRESARGIGQQKACHPLYA